MTGEFPAQRASNVENVSIWWRHHVFPGAKLGEIRLPTKNITSCCFGGPAYEDLYVTSARYGVSEEQLRTTQSLAGSIFKVTGLGVKGLPGAVYRGWQIFIGFSLAH